MAKFTVAQLKTSLNKAGDRSGFAFIKNNPFYANHGRLEAMKARWQEVFNLNKHSITAKQVQSIENYLADLGQKFVW